MVGKNSCRALSLETGKQLWQHGYSDFLSDTIYHRYATSSPSIDPETGNVYMQGTQGILAGFTADGKKYLDAAGGAAVVSIGHGVAAIGRAMAEQAEQLAFAHTSQFHTGVAERLAGRLLGLAPRTFRAGGRVYFTSGGSEATETAIKLARQYFVERGEPARTRIVSRWQSYHGSTLGALAVSGKVTIPPRSVMNRRRRM